MNSSVDESVGGSVDGDVDKSDGSVDGDTDKSD